MQRKNGFWVVVLSAVMLGSATAGAATVNLDDVLLSNAEGLVILRDGGNLDTKTYDNNYGNVTSIRAQVTDDSYAVIGSDVSDGLLTIRQPSGTGGPTDWTGKATLTGTGYSNYIAVQPGTNIVVGTSDGSLKIRDNQDLGTKVSDGGFGEIRSIAVQSNGNVVVANWSHGSPQYQGVFLRNGTDLNGIGSCVTGLGTNPVVAVQAGTDNIIIGTSDSSLWLRDANDLDTGIGSLSGVAGGAITCVASLSDGSIVSGSDGGYLRLWYDDLSNDYATLTGLGTITALAIQSDDDIVVGTAEGTVSILRYTDGEGWDTIATDDGNGAITSLDTFVPEPTTLGVLLTGGVLVMRKRRG
ncbi:MAG: PEP-CTERM sorting domain-containing protein [Phycisphaerae bacterium]|nr:PEP-CTERM sorting domain-containing protein [Phycisphaerae bacterium]